MKNIIIKPLVFAAMTCLCINNAAQAQNVIGLGEPTGDNGGFRADTYVAAGFEFFAPAGSGTTINSLGFWDQGGDGLLSAHTVSLYAYAGTGSDYNLLATATIDAGTVDPLINGYRWVNIGNLTLPDNGQGGGYYCVLASQNLDVWANGIGGSPILNSAIGTFSASALIDENSGQTITQTPVVIIGNAPGTPPDGYGGGNLAFIQAVPEPATYALVGGGLTLLLGFRRKK